jgi:outer membrane protein TolC
MVPWNTRAATDLVALYKALGGGWVSRKDVASQG